MKLKVKEKTEKTFTIKLTRKEADQLLNDLVDLGAQFNFDHWELYPAAAAIQRKLGDTL